ncbi:MAG: DUF4011 domain-containing protein, partial [Eubacteriales bacterium]|nr:DUF4011 domain-containing protein [Eubacteriales bacterium]
MCKVRVSVDRRAYANYSMQLNHVPLIRAISIQNTGSHMLERLTLQLMTEPPFTYPFSVSVGSIAPGAAWKSDVVKLFLDPEVLSRCRTTAVRVLRVILTADGETLYDQREELVVHAFHERSFQEQDAILYASLVQPQEPAVRKILTDARAYCADIGSGYQRDALAQVAAIYRALHSYQIGYCSPPLPSEEGFCCKQLPAEVLELRQGDCGSLSLLFASCAEAAGLNPVIICTKTHMQCGVWLDNSAFADPVVYDFPTIQENLDRFIPIECTMLCNPDSSVEDSVSAAVQSVYNATDFRFAVDVAVARKYHIRPIDSSILTTVLTQEPQPRAAAAAQPEIFAPQAAHAASVSEKLQNRLLSLSARSPLLSMDENAPYLFGTAQMILDAVKQLKTESGTSVLRLQPKPMSFDTAERSAEFFAAVEGEDPLAHFIRSHAREQGILHISEDEKAMDSSIARMLQAQKHFQSECGVHPLCLGLGAVGWMDQAQKIRKAPLLLLPAQLYRHGSEVRIACDLDELMLNASIAEFLKLKHALDLELNFGYVKDQNAFDDIGAVFAHVQKMIRNQASLRFYDQSVLSVFNFSLFPIWHEQKRNAERFARHPLSGSILARQRLWKTKPERAVAAEPLCPLPADAYQKQAIRMALGGESFVLNGPPGTGKSQTIARIIANLLEQGKKVLFVSAKAVALEVVRKRLDTIGIADHCLMLSQDTTLT